ncbi:MAG: hypothetical protein ACFE8U_12390 [Candidatus Hermodarchaeota archaeon]
MIERSKFSFNKPGVTDKEIINYINHRESIIIISFISPYSGIPHLCPVWGIYFNGGFFFQTEDYTAKIKSIKSGYDKIGISVVDPQQFPEYSEDSIPYLSLGGTATIRTKEDFSDFEKILKLIFLKYIEEKEERDKVTNFVLEEVKTRVLIEVDPEWVKVAQVPKTKD